MTSLIYTLIVVPGNVCFAALYLTRSSSVVNMEEVVAETVLTLCRYYEIRTGLCNPR